jgi:hypothetical protein
MTLRAIPILMTVAALCPAQGLKPRPQPSGYPVQQSAEGAILGAALLSPGTVARTFASDLNRGYVVVEIAVYPKPGGSFEVSAQDFLLRVAGTTVTARAVRPKAVAAVLQKTAPADRDIDVYPTTGVGYETGGYDPMTGRRRGGWVTSTGVGVGVGGRRPASTDRDRRTMETELSEQGLPEGKADKAVAGYLYFPMRSGKKPVTYELQYLGPTGTVTLALPR